MPLIENESVAWHRWQEYTPEHTIFDGSDTPPSLQDALQNQGGTCYAIAAMAAVAEKEGMVKDLFLTQEKNDAGIHAVKLYIRGKPWVLTLDDSLLFVDSLEDAPEDDYPYLLFANATDEEEGGLMWGPILEKAWAKAKGAYYNASGGTSLNSLRRLTGNPVFE